MPGIKIDDEQYDLIDKLINHPKIKAEYSFRSVTDFIRDSIRDKVKEIKRVIEGEV